MGSPVNAVSLFLLVLLASSLALAQQTITGRASVIDGDTIEIRGQRIRLAGIDTPESAQLCYNSKGQMFRCGALVANNLSSWLGQRTVTCRTTGESNRERLIANCMVGGVDVAGWLASQGYGFIDPRFATNHRARVEQARSRRVNLWAGRFQLPWEYRRQGRAATYYSALTAPRPAPTPSRPFVSCAEARAAGVAPVRRGQPGYNPRLDRDGDGVACE